MPGGVAEGVPGKKCRVVEDLRVTAAETCPRGVPLRRGGVTSDVTRHEPLPPSIGYDDDPEMPRSRFRPYDPDSIHKRFEQIKARAFQRIEEERRRLATNRTEPRAPAAEPPPLPVRPRKARRG
jgi:hypothetical protein